MSFEFARQIVDAGLKVTHVLPAANANVNTSTIDLGATSAYNQGEGVAVQIEVPAMSAYTDSSKSITLKVQHSSDDSSYSDLGITDTIPGVASTGTSAYVRQFRLPPDCKRYLQLNIAAASGGADVTAITATFKLVF